MKIKISPALIFSILFVLTGASNLSFGQEPATPGPEHELLKKLEGTWTAKIKLGDQESPGTVTYKMELGGLWLVSKFEGELFGAKFEGRGMDSYDAKTKKYVSVWADSMTARPMVMEGTYDKEKKTLTMKGDAPSPEDKPFKMVTQFKDDDHHTFTMYVINDGNEEKVMSTEYTRKK